MHKRIIVALVAAVLIATALVGCPSNQPVAPAPVVVQQPAPAPVVYQQPAPQVIYQQPAQVVHHDSGVGTFVAGAATGAIVHHALSRPRVVYVPHSRLVVRRRYYRRF